MDRLSEIQARLQNLGDLRNVVGAMRSLAAVRVQQARATLPGIRKYTEVIDEALARAFALGAPAGPSSSAPAGHGPLEGGSAAIVFSSEQGFVGAFNERILDRAVAQLARPADPVLMVGSRGAALAAERHVAVPWTLPMATHRDGVVAVARGVATEVYRRAALGQLGRVTLVYGKTSGGAASEVVVRTLLPFDPTPYLAADAKAAPPLLTNLAPRELVDRLVDEVVLAELMRAAMESFASENGARLATMEAAYTSIDAKLAQLSQEERLRRQDEITTELLDIVTGAEAVAGERSTGGGAARRGDRG